MPRAPALADARGTGRIGGALAFAAPIAFGERIVEERADIVIFAVVWLFFGLVMGHSWFREPDAM